MNSDFSVQVSEQYDFSRASLPAIDQNQWVRDQWPVVYFIRDDIRKIGYVGESAQASTRIRNHLRNSDRRRLTKISIIGSDQFNKSVTLDIEAKLIQYLSADLTYTLENGNYGMVDHEYYQKKAYRAMFTEIWDQLLQKNIVSKPLQEIENSELFKYSPYKSLNQDQYHSVVEMLQVLASQTRSTIVVNGSAGTGKTILAAYMIKLLKSDLYKIADEELTDEEIRELNLIKLFQQRHPDMRIGFVIAMSSLRKTIKNVFRKTPGLNASMVLSPSDTFKLNEKYDLLVVDEAHRLRRYKNIGWRKVFMENNRKLGLDDTGTELDWIMANSHNQIFFYDPEQSVRPSDIEPAAFNTLLMQQDTVRHELKSQMRVLGGNDYIDFVRRLLNVDPEALKPYEDNRYELRLFDNLDKLYAELGRKEKKHGLARLVAGYSWPWLSKKKKSATDIEIDGLTFQWNQDVGDWINSENAYKEIGCIHTTQGYDLNYAGIIFGREIDYNPVSNEIEINPALYFDKAGKAGVRDPAQLKSYILNIYRTNMYRGIRGTFIYAYNQNLRNYFKGYITAFDKR